MTRQTSHKRERGQALVEFAFTLPILLLFAAGVFDFGRVFFVYAQASNSLRQAVREAPVVGYASGAPSYLDCENMIDIADNVIGADAVPDVEVYYYESELPLNATTELGHCVGSDIDPPDESDLENGDILKIKSSTTITPVMFSFIGFTFEFKFEGQRTIVKSFNIGATDCALTWAPPNDGDEDYDGLCDGWEILWFGNTGNYIATDDTDLDGCNNGCEESNNTNPLAAP